MKREFGPGLVETSRAEREVFSYFNASRARLGTGMDLVVATPAPNASVDHDIFCGSVGPQDMLYLPAGFMFFERILRGDVSGIRCIMTSLEDVAELEAINQHLISVKKPHPKLQGILDQLVLLEAS